jgi:hypothetical protein
VGTNRHGVFEKNALPIATALVNLGHFVSAGNELPMFSRFQAAMHEGIFREDPMFELDAAGILSVVSSSLWKSAVNSGELPPRLVCVCISHMRCADACGSVLLERAAELASAVAFVPAVDKASTSDPVFNYLTSGGIAAKVEGTRLIALPACIFPTFMRLPYLVYSALVGDLKTMEVIRSWTECAVPAVSKREIEVLALLFKFGVSCPSAADCRAGVVYLFCCRRY